MGGTFCQVQGRYIRQSFYQVYSGGGAGGDAGHQVRLNAKALADPNHGVRVRGTEHRELSLVGQ